MDKSEVIAKLREMADALEKGTAELNKVEVMLSGDAEYNELKIGLRYRDQLKQMPDNHTVNNLDFPPK